MQDKNTKLVVQVIIVKVMLLSECIFVKRLTRMKYLSLGELV